MIPEQRRTKILEKLNKKNIYTLDDLARELKVSRITIQRDVNMLEKKELLERIHGGVRLNKKADNSFESRFNLRLSQNYEKKLEIAKKALEFINESNNIFLDSSTTSYILAKELFKKKYYDLNIITTSPALICESLKYPNLKIISTGGELRSDFNIFSGSWVLDFLEKINIDSAFISAAGITRDGKITYNNKELANTISAIIPRSSEINL
ncbi:MAG: DeoR/GlpR transcriptional regulator, partial [Actinomycetota bacterium]